MSMSSRVRATRWVFPKRIFFISSGPQSIYREAFVKSTPLQKSLPAPVNTITFKDSTMFDIYCIHDLRRQKRKAQFQSHVVWIIQPFYVLDHQGVSPYGYYLKVKSPVDRQPGFIIDGRKAIQHLVMDTVQLLQSFLSAPGEYKIQIAQFQCRTSLKKTFDILEIEIT